jgi:septum site-determining protein MinD
MRRSKADDAGLEEASMPDSQEFPKSLSIAVLSGKGGSGKTLIALSLSRALQGNGSILIVDADPGTGGLSYFLSVNYIRSQGLGLIGLLMGGLKTRIRNASQLAEAFEPTGIEDTPDATDLTEPVASKLAWTITPTDLNGAIRPLKGTQECFALPIGDIRQLIGTRQSEYRDRIRPTISEITRLEHRFKIFDCRGGVDPFTVEICRQADLILVVTETDVASVQSTKNVLEILEGYEPFRSCRWILYQSLIR